MIAYLEQLEHDLVEAIERREAAARQTRRLRRLTPPRPRRSGRWAPAALVAAALLLAILAALLVHGPSTVPPPQHREARPGPIPRGTPLRLVGTVERLDLRTWSGPARGPGGTGTLTITGTTDFSHTTCCDTPRSLGPGNGHALRFRFAVSGGSLSACVVTTILRRPHGRWVWDGAGGRVLAATGRLRRYRGLSWGIAGKTRLATRRTSRIIVGSARGDPAPGRC